MRPHPGFPQGLRAPLITLLLLATGAPAHARWTQNGVDFLGGNGGLPIQHVFPATNGGIVAITGDANNSASDLERITGDGERDWNPGYGLPALVFPNPDATLAYGLAPAPSGGYYFGWDQRSYDSQTFFLATRPHVTQVDASRAPLWDDSGMLPFLSGAVYAEASAICAGAGGDAIIASVELDSLSFFPHALRVQRVRPDSTRAWGPNGVILQPTFTVATYLHLQLLPDGLGGAFLLWAEQDPDTFDWMYRVQRISAAGAALWPAGGVLAMSHPGSSPEGLLLSDGAGGVYFCTRWNGDGNFRVSATRISSGGVPLWSAGGLTLLTPEAGVYPYTIDYAADAAGLRVVWNQAGHAIQLQRFAPANGGPLFGQVVTVASEAASNALQTPHALAVSGGETIVGWGRQATSPTGVFVNRVGASGGLLWSAVGLPLEQATGDGAAGAFEMVTDAEDGAIGMIQRYHANGSITWNAQRILAGGDLPMVSGTLTGAADVPGDQGGALALGYRAPYADAGEELPEISGYNVWRRVAGTSPAAGAHPAGAADAALETLAASAHGRVRITEAQAQRLRFPPGTWESLGFQAAVLDSDYRFVIATVNDSGPAVPNADEAFVVTAHTPVPSLFGVSNLVSGHSRDNLAPAAPQQLSGAYAGGHLTLNWVANGEHDLAGYAVYRGTSAGFTPSPATKLAAVGVPGFTDPAFVNGCWYKLTALDWNGNESPVATLAPTQVTDVADAPRVNFLRVAGGQPVAGAVTVEFSLAMPGFARVTLIDAQGRLVRVLADAAFAAGPQRLAWDRRGADALRAGIYFVRLTSPGYTASRKVVALD